MKDKKRLINFRTILGVAVLVGIMLIVGSLLGLKMNQLLTKHIESQVTEQAKNISQQMEQVIEVQFVQLSNLANALQSNPEYLQDVLQTVKSENEGISVGMIAFFGFMMIGLLTTDSLYIRYTSHSMVEIIIAIVIDVLFHIGQAVHRHTNLLVDLTQKAHAKVERINLAIDSQFIHCKFPPKYYLKMLKKGP